MCEGVRVDDTLNHQHSELYSVEQCATAHTLSAMHEPNIKEIDEEFSSFEHSVNLLDNLCHTDKEIGFS